jgi:cysteine desulfurase/selenocysteine lyase
MKTVYLDYASTAPRHPLVIQAREEFELSHYANVGRGLYTLAEEAQQYYHNSKKRVAEWIGCEPIEVLYTYSATYAMNILALAIEHNGIIGK